MPTGTIKRHDTEPSAVINVTVQGGTAYDLTNHTVRMVMSLKTTLSTTMTSAQLTIDLPVAIVDVIELGDILLVGHERMTIVTPLPDQPIGGSTFTANITRATSVAATAGAILGTLDVAGTGTNIYRLGTDAVFNIEVDGGNQLTVTVTSASTSTNNVIADLIADINTALTTATAAATASAVNSKVQIASDTTGAASSIAISSPDAVAQAELGLIASYGAGEAAKATVANEHTAADIVDVIKVDRLALINNPPTGGIATFEWLAGDTDRLGTYTCEWEFVSLTGKKFTLPIDSSYTVEVVADFDDQ